MLTMKTKTDPVPITLTPFDPLPLVQTLHPSAGRPAHHTLVTNVNYLTAAQRAMLGGLVLHSMARHRKPGDMRGQAGYIAARAAEALHARYERVKVGGYGHDLSGYYVEDADERGAWRKLRLALQGPELNNVNLIESLILALVEAGDLRETLLRKRAHIDALLDQLPEPVAEPEPAA